MKIKSVTVGEAKPVFEKGLLKRIVGAADSLKKSGTPDEEDSGEEHNTLSAAGETATQQVLGRIFSVPSDSKRGILFLNDSDLKDRYLGSKGEAKIATAVTNEQLAAIFPNADFQLGDEVDQADSIFVVGTDDFDLHALDEPISAKRPFAVLLNIPANVAQNFTTKSPANLDEARQVLQSAISHSYYIATLNASAIKRAAVGALDNREEREDMFNIKKFITAYPIRSVIDAAREEQDERDDHKKLTPTSMPKSDTPAPKAAPAQLTRGDLDLASQIAASARREFFKASSKSNWPTSSDGLLELRGKLVAALTKDSRIGDNKKIIPAIVKAFYNNQVKQDAHYKDLVNLLKDDPELNKAVAGDVPAEPEAPTETPAEEPRKSVSPEELAAAIAQRGPDFVDQVTKILSGSPKKAALLQPK